MTKVIDFPADRISKGVHLYYPDMGERRINAQLEASLSHYGKHYFVDSPIELPKARGIEFLKRYEPQHFVDGAKNRKVGWFQYKVTIRAFEKMKQQYSITIERYLD